MKKRGDNRWTQYYQIQKFVFLLLFIYVYYSSKIFENFFKISKNLDFPLESKKNKSNIYFDNIIYKLNFSDINNNKFAILKRTNCPTCGLFSFYNVYLGCINKYLSKGYIPIVDMKSFENIYNNYTLLNNNIWELFFEQPFGYTLEEIEKKAKFKEEKICESSTEDLRPNELDIYYSPISIDYWHYFAKKFMPIKKEIIEEADTIMKKLFYESKNILGVKLRGTDYIAMRPGGHPKMPNLKTTITDVKNMDIKNNYDWIFISSEDERIKERYINEFKKKIKYLNPKVSINYNYEKPLMITENEIIKGNLDYARNYLLNIIILSKCTDLVTVRCSGAAGIFILTEGFRNTLIYNLGLN